jgi:hypothetical protein
MSDYFIDRLDDTLPAFATSEEHVLGVATLPAFATSEEHVLGVAMRGG